MQPETYDYQYITANGGGTAQDVNYLQGGSGYADMLEGAGGWGISSTFSPHPALAQKYFGIYTQNDFHATSKLTLNLGLRWEFQPGPTDRFNRASDLNLNQDNAYGIPGVYVIPGQNGVSRNLWKSTHDDFGPRVGAAYRLGDKSVIRAGYGVSFRTEQHGMVRRSVRVRHGRFRPRNPDHPLRRQPEWHPGELLGSQCQPHRPCRGSQPECSATLRNGLPLLQL